MQLELFDARALQSLVRYLNVHGARSETLLDRAHIPDELIEEGGWVGNELPCAKKKTPDAAWEDGAAPGSPMGIG